MSLNNGKSDAIKFNRHVINSVIEQCKKVFIEEGFDDAVLGDLRTMWSHRLEQLTRLHRQEQLARSHPSQAAPFAIAATVDQGLLSSAAHAAMHEFPPDFLPNPTLPPRLPVFLLNDGNQVMLQMKYPSVTQLDGATQDSSSEEDGNYRFSEEEHEDEEEGEPQDAAEGVEDPKPLCSDDDGSEPEDAEKLFDTENLVLAQYDKISRSKNKWKFSLKAGVMNLNGCDYVFSKANGDAEW